MNPVQNLVAEFLTFVLGGNGASKADGLALIRLLDRLAAAYHEISDSTAAPDGSPEPRRENGEKLRERISRRFPDYGYYNVPDTLTDSISDTAVIVGDAIDDLVDIAGDLSEIRWRFENTSAEDALHHYRLLFDLHWGEHLRWLQVYLHYLRRGR